MNKSPVGVFDSGYGGLTVLKEITAMLPQYDYIYLGDNGRAPYGNRSFETIYQYTWQCVQWFFAQGCPLVVLACNTASAKALRSIQQNDLPMYAPNKKVLGVIRPTTEVIGNYSKTKKVGILATNGTVQSKSYPIEINKFFPNVKVYQLACPMWVSLVENNEYKNDGADYFIYKNIKQIMQQNEGIDTLLLACTHYPLLMDKIKKYVPAGVTVITQGEIAAASLSAYLQKHTEIEMHLSKGGEKKFYTTDSTEDFDAHAAVFYGSAVQSIHVDIL